jgi:hypothetical protein
LTVIFKLNRCLWCSELSPTQLLLLIIRCLIFDWRVEHFQLSVRLKTTLISVRGSQKSFGSQKTKNWQKWSFLKNGCSSCCSFYLPSSRLLILVNYFFVKIEMTFLKCYFKDVHLNVCLLKQLNKEILLDFTSLLKIFYLIF